MTQTIQEAVASVQNAPGSMYTREDVISLLNKLEIQDASKIIPLTAFQIEHLINTVTDAITENAENVDNNCVDKDSAEFSLNYNNYVELDNVGIDNNFIVDAVTDGIDNVIIEWFEKAFPKEETITDESVSENE